MRAPWRRPGNMLQLRRTAWHFRGRTSAGKSKRPFAAARRVDASAACGGQLASEVNFSRLLVSREGLRGEAGTAAVGAHRTAGRTRWVRVRPADQRAAALPGADCKAISPPVDAGWGRVAPAAAPPAALGEECLQRRTLDGVLRRRVMSYSQLPGRARARHAGSMCCLGGGSHQSTTASAHRSLSPAAGLTPGTCAERE